MKRTIVLFTIFLLLSCKTDKKSNHPVETIPAEDTLTKKVEVNKFENYFVRDTTAEKKGRFNFLNMSNTKESDSIIALCTCDKNVKNNLMKIQLKTGIPNKSVLDTLKKENRKGNKILEIGGYNRNLKINGQFKFLTIVVKDSIVKSINLYSKSTKKEYNGTDFDSMNINKYQIKISKMDYSIASDIYGSFILHLPEEFGYFKNDTILNGNFECYNWRISDKESIRNWNINEWYQKKQASRGLRVIE
jgi:hypothetical protein